MTHREPERIVVEQHRVACDGGGGALGHPLVYLELGQDHRVVCPYCSREFVRRTESRAVRN